MTWQPIEMVPDKTDVLVCVTYSLGAGIGGETEWETVQWVDAFLGDDAGWCNFPFMIWVPFEPTHWQPLPPPPVPA